jgi:hypothetical protein
VSQVDPAIQRGWPAVDTFGRMIGTVDAVFVDYLLVRTAGLLPVDLYVPRPSVTVADGRVILEASTREDAYRRWHRPLRAAPHD